MNRISVPDRPDQADAGSATTSGVSDGGSDFSNVVAIAGVAFCVVAAGLYIALFYSVYQLPADQKQLEQLRGSTPILMRLVVLGASAGLMNLVGLVLCSIGMLTSNQSRWIALLGTIASALMLLSLGAVVFISALAG